MSSSALGNFISRRVRLSEPMPRSNLAPSGSRVMDQKPYPAEKARGGEIILTTPLRRVIFLSGLVGAIALAIILMLVR